MEKERRTKALLLSTLVVVVATLSIAFAAMSRVLNINGTAKMDTASWSVYFDNLSKANIVRGAEEIGTPNISTTDNGIIENINVKLSNPKDEISYTVDIVNDGTIDAEITMIKDVELTDVQKKVFEFKVYYTETGEVLQNGDLLPKDTTRNITITIRFKDDITEYDLPTENQVINLSYQLTYTQYDGGGAIVGPNGGEVTTEKAVLASGISLDELWEVDDATFFDGEIGRGYVESISFVNNKNVPANASSTVWDASEAKDNSIVGWYQDTDSNELYEVYIGSDVNIYAPSDSSGMFACFYELKELNLNNFNTSEVTNMMGMFACVTLTSLDLSSFNTENVTDMAWMFIESNSLENLNLSSFNTSEVTNMERMFAFCQSLNKINLSNFETSNVTNMSEMFIDCQNLTNLDLSSFNTGNVTDMSGMFSQCFSLTSIDLSSFNTSNVTDMATMFYGCSSMKELDLSSFDTSDVTNMENMFEDCSELISLDLSSFDTLNVTNMSNMFRNCSELISLDLRNADFSNVSEFYNMFFVKDGPDINPQIIVKDETQRTWLISNFTNLTNVVLPSEL